MRTLIMLSSVAMLLAGTAAAEPSSERFETMSPDEVARHAAPYENRVARCYKKHVRPTGDLSIYVVISRAGKVVYSEIAAPGVSAQRKRPLDRCLRDEVMTWRFPAKTGFTNATIPYRIRLTPPPPGPFPNT